MVLIEYFKDFKFFPTYDYKFRLLDNEADSIERLTRRTEHTYKLCSITTDKSFIGKVETNKFRIITSDIGKGAVWIMEGFIGSEKCEVKMILNFPFRTGVLIIYGMVLLGFVFNLINEEISKYPFLLLAFMGQFLLLRYVFFDFLVKKLAKISLYKLRDVIDFELID